MLTGWRCLKDYLYEGVAKRERHHENGAAHGVDGGGCMQGVCLQPAGGAGALRAERAAHHLAGVPAALHL